VYFELFVIDYIKKNRKRKEKREGQRERRTERERERRKATPLFLGTF
jgi:hypothetical protein